MNKPYAYRGATALVTGASSGIGREYARELARRGADVILLARNREALDDLAAEITTTHGVRTWVLPLDLTRPDAATTVRTALSGWDVEPDVLVNNAGFASYGPVAESDPDRDAAMVQVNIAALVRLTRMLLPSMTRRRSGLVVNVASNTAFQPLPYFALYAATKAFVLSYTEALHAEVAGSGVRVLALCPGATDTPFFDHAAGAERGPKQTVEQVVTTAFRAVDKARPSVVSGALNRVTATVLPRLLPRRVVLAVAHRTMAPR